MKKLKLSTLPWVHLDDRNELPDAPGIYFALCGREVLYIGRAQNLNRRWRRHHRTLQLECYNRVRLCWLEWPHKQELSELEAQMKAAFNPRLNGSAVLKDYEHEWFMAD